ncbi:uncharacterized protein BKA55DRAFT_545955 [Fusarium redolens]|uniref:Uncharacterized protein n=1 Tax=Fusarium redolens TaxID=48865 RepID=A0A9P9JUC2_FUSRE|nr:uncharacterized protein BKA55DRAFT_545955 [Fusarium redolens]KAH7224370.1 hypothetical protein BKA55DRAFT_545955 [Fusarium redolens]
MGGGSSKPKVTYKTKIPNHPKHHAPLSEKEQAEFTPYINHSKNDGRQRFADQYAKQQKDLRSAGKQYKRINRSPTKSPPEEYRVEKPPKQEPYRPSRRLETLPPLPKGNCKKRPPKQEPYRPSHRLETLPPLPKGYCKKRPPVQEPLPKKPPQKESSAERPPLKRSSPKKSSGWDYF